MNRTAQLAAVAVGVLALSVSLLAQAGEVDAAAASTAAKKASDFLVSQQNEAGGFGKSKAANVPGIVGLVVKAIASTPEKPRENNNPALAKAAKLLTSKQQADGSIAIPGFGHENMDTSIAVIGLAALENPAYKDVLDKAQAYILSCQKGGDAGADKEGGFAYNAANNKPDNNNGGFSLEALKAAGLKEDSPAWKNAVKFMKRSQDNAETNDGPAIMKEGDNTGGFIYAPGVADDFGSVKSKRTGKDVPKPYGNMTYQCVKGLIYAKVDKNDPSMQAAIKWIKSNYSVTENPGGKGTMGYYYYIRAFAKAFSAMGDKEITLADGKKVSWAKDMATQIVSLQKPDGSFINADTEWMEGDPVLATAYALEALNDCIAAMK
jgi:squalene-hopene/tetraprenyl-beta-curcumene cyclase